MSVYDINIDNNIFGLYPHALKGEKVKNIHVGLAVYYIYVKKYLLDVQ